jgi:Lrp/AsnC family transcriptional regulator, leucine-responsive regulatory protein
MENMPFMDKKDRMILYELDANSRQSYSQIGKKVGLKKDVVGYRIKKLEDEGIIQNYYTVIDSYRLGYFIFRYYINFQYVSPDIKKSIITYFKDYKNICTIGSAIGKYDLIVVAWVNNMNEFYQFWNDALDQFGEYFENRIFSVYIRGMGFRQTFLIPESFPLNDREVFVRFGAGKNIQIDELDYHLLNEIALNARMPLIELAEKLKTSSQTVTYRIKNLTDNGIIQAFRVNINEMKLGFKRYKVDIFLKKHKHRSDMITYIRKNPFVLYISASAGLSDLEVEMIVESPEQLISILEDVNMKFPNAIRNYNFYGDITISKETFLPRLFD